MRCSEGVSARRERAAWPIRKVRINRRATSWMVVGLVALGCRLLLAIPALGDPRRFFVSPDSFEYDRLALNLVAGHGYSLATSSPFTPDVSRTPTYPLVLAAIYALAGHEPRAAVAVNILLGAGACILTALIGRRALGARAGTLAGLFLATDLTSVVYSLTLMTEPIFTVLILLCTLKIVQIVGNTRSGVGGTLQAAVWCGLAILTRPIGLFLPLVLGPMLGVFRPSAVDRKRLTVVFCFTAIALLFPAAWTVRNYLVAGLAQPTSIIAINAYYHRAVVLEAREAGHLPTEEGEATDEGDPVSQRTADDKPADLVNLERQAAQIVLTDPLGYARLHLGGTAEMLRPDRDIFVQIVNGALTARDRRRATSALEQTVAKTQLVVLYALSACGVLLGLRRAGERQMVTLFVVIVLYFLVISGPEAYARFRVPVMPFITLLAAGGARACGEIARTAFRGETTIRPASL